MFRFFNRGYLLAAISSFIFLVKRFFFICEDIFSSRRFETVLKDSFNTFEFLGSKFKDFVKSTTTLAD